MCIYKKEMSQTLKELQEMLKRIQDIAGGKKAAHIVAQKKYYLTEKGKAARLRAYKKSYKPKGERGRPRKVVVVIPISDREVDEVVGDDL